MHPGTTYCAHMQRPASHEQRATVSDLELGVAAVLLLLTVLLATLLVPAIG